MRNEDAVWQCGVCAAWVKSRYGVFVPSGNRNPRTGFTWTAKGGFKSSGAAATGTLRVKARFNDENVQDPKGNITCDSGTLKWSVKRK